MATRARCRIEREGFRVLGPVEAGNEGERTELSLDPQMALKSATDS